MQAFALRAAINISYREIAAQRGTPTSFLSLISLKTTLVGNNIYLQKRLNWVFLMHRQK